MHGLVNIVVVLAVALWTLFVPVGADAIASYKARDQVPSYLYDLNSNTLLPAGEQFPDEYDKENRLIRRTRELVIGETPFRHMVELVYDGDGQRVRKTNTWLNVTDPNNPSLDLDRSYVVYYFVDDRNPTGYAQVIAEEAFGYYLQVDYPRYDKTVHYVYGLDLISQRMGNSSDVYFYGYDGHGSVRYLTDGEVTWPENQPVLNVKVTDTYTYDAFGVMLEQRARNGVGELVLTTEGGVPTLNRYLYAGEQWDEDLKVYYNRARYLNPGTGRFWTQDSFEGYQTEPFSLHRYLYANANPVNGLDPSGQMTLIEVKLVAAEVVMLATVMLYRATPAFNRATIVLFEASTGNSVYMGGQGALVALKAGISQGGVVWRTWQYVGNLLKGRKIGTYKTLSPALKGSGEHANHLNQAGAFPNIPYDEGVVVAMEGSAFSKITKHGKFHEALELFWAPFRQANTRPTNAEYSQALRRALQAGGHSTDEADALVKLADEARRAYGYVDGPGGLRPEVPSPLNQY